MLNLASRYRIVGRAEEARAEELCGLGFDAYDALHLACAEETGCEVFLTTDDRLLRRAQRNRGRLRVNVANPLQWLWKTER